MYFAKIVHSSVQVVLDEYGHMYKVVVNILESMQSVQSCIYFAEEGIAGCPLYKEIKLVSVEHCKVDNENGCQGH